MVGEAFAGALPDGVRVCTKVELPDAQPAALERRIEESLRESLERLRLERGDVGAWGLTAIGWPPLVLELLSEEPRPHAVQCVANALDFSGDVWVFGDAGRPDNAAIRERATELGGRRRSPARRGGPGRRAGDRRAGGQEPCGAARVPRRRGGRGAGGGDDAGARGGVTGDRAVRTTPRPQRRRA